MGASTCCAEAEADTQFTIFDLSALKKQCLILSCCRLIGELCPNSTKFSIPSQKIDIDKKARFHNQVGYWLRWIYAKICGAAADADTQFAFFDSSALNKQCLISFSQLPGWHYNFHSVYGSLLDRAGWGLVLHQERPNLLLLIPSRHTTLSTLIFCVIRS